MATLAGMTIADKDSSLDSGAAFLLAQRCDVSKTVYPNSNSEVEIREGCPYVVVRIQGASSAGDAFEKGHDAAQKGLDLLSIRYRANLSLENAANKYLVWWREESTQILRVVTVDEEAVSGSATSFNSDKGGNITPLPSSPEPIYHESLRYIRLSQVTDDLFDAFRNMYLAFELLLQHISPRIKSKTKNDREMLEKEGQWIKRVLKIINDDTPLSEVYDSKAYADIVSDIYHHIYENVRCKIFHAKDAYLLPQNLVDRKIVSEGLRSLTGIVLLLADKHLHASASDGGMGMTYAAFEDHAKGVFSNSTITLSDNESLDNSEALAGLEFEGLIPMVTKHIPDLSEPGLSFVLGMIEADKLNSLCKISRLDLVRGGEMILPGPLESSLTYHSIDRFEAQVGLQLRNVKLPKRFFNSLVVQKTF